MSASVQLDGTSIDVTDDEFEAIEALRWGDYDPDAHGDGLASLAQKLLAIGEPA